MVFVLVSGAPACLCREIGTTLVLAGSWGGERTSLSRYLKCGQALKSDS